MSDKKYSSMSILTDLLAALRAAHWVHWTSHWQVQGAPYYGDHLLLERLYTSVVDEIDTLAEKLVAEYGSSVVNPIDQARRTSRIIENVCSNPNYANPIQRSLFMERKLMKLFNETFKHLESTNQLSLGMNDFISATANAHETNIYLLQQRVR